MKKCAAEILVEGYAHRTGTRSSCVFPVDSHPGAPGPFVEYIQPGAFRLSLFWNRNILLTVDHKRIIGSTRDGRLRLSEDDTGLKAVARIRDSDDINSAKNGRIQGWSFTFVPVQTEWKRIGADLYRRTLKRVYLTEVSLEVSGKPAYPGTTVNLVEVNGYDSI